MEKLILDNKTDLPMIVFLKIAMEVIQRGRISNDGKEYCYLTSFDINNEEYHVVSDLNKRSDKLTLYKVLKQ